MENEDRLAHALEWGEMLKKVIERRLGVKFFLLRAEKAMGMERYRLTVFNPCCLAAMQEMRRRRN